MFAPDFDKYTSRSVPSPSLSFLTRGEGGPIFTGVCAAPYTLWL